MKSGILYRVLILIALLGAVSCQRERMTTEPEPDDPGGPQQVESTKLTAGDALSGDFFGRSVSFSEDNLLVGASAANGAGRVYVYERESAGWREADRLVAGDGDFFDVFGFATAVVSDMALIGAWGNDEGGDFAGAAYIFVRSDSGWVESVKLTAGDKRPDHFFGVSLALGSDVAVVGATGDDEFGAGAGAVYIFEKQGENWVQTAKLTPGIASPGARFGNAVAFRDDILAVGAPGAAVNGLPGGAVYVFLRDGPAMWRLADLLSGTGVLADGGFGSDVAVEGDRILAGVRREADGLPGAHLFEGDESDSWTEVIRLLPDDPVSGPDVIVRVALLGTRALISTTDEGAAGAVHVFSVVDDAWEQQPRLQPSDGGTNDLFGISLAISNNQAFVGSLRNSGAAPQAGAVYIFDIDE